MQDKFVHTPHGRIHLHVAGGGPPLMLLHSNGGSAFEWEHALPLLAKNFSVFAWDMPGHGDSDPICGHCSVETYADAVSCVMDALGLHRAHVLGSSIGGAICIAFGARHPDRTACLLPVETPVRSPEEWKSGWFATEKMFGSVTQTEEQVRPRFRKVSPEFLARWNIDRAKAGVRSMIGVMWALRDFDVLATAARITAPTLLVYGDRGPTLARSPDLLTRIAGAEFTKVPDAGHFPMIDDPEAFVDAVRRFAQP